MFSRPMNAGTVIFLIAVAFVVYVLAGYPLLLSIWARLFPRSIIKQFAPARISILIPVRNGRQWIRPKLQSLLASDYPHELIDILIISDGSTDGTNEAVESFGDPRVRLLALPPGGKATAVTHGLEVVNSEIVVLTDVRQLFDSQALRKLIACFADPAVGVVTGELIIRSGLSSEEHNTGLYWRYEKWIRRNLNRIDAMLGATGSIYAIRRSLAAAIPREILLDDVYLPFKASFAGYRIYFEDEAKAYDLPTSLQTEFWRKVRTQAGIYQIVRYFPALLWPVQRRFIHWCSHKMGRLLLPFAMLAAAVSSFWLPNPWKTIVLAVQAVFYGLALLDPVIREANPVKRLSAVIRAFLTLVAAALCAPVVLVLPAQRLWKETRVSAARDQAWSPRR